MTSFLSSPSREILRRAAVVLMVLTLMMPLGTVSADARAGGGFSFGSRGARSFSVPPTTSTAPRSAFPLPGAQSPGFGGGPSFAQPRRFGFGSGLAAGLLGAGLFGMLTGHGFFGGLGGIMSLFGLLIQIALVVLVVRWALAFFRNRNGAAFAGAAGPMPRSAPAGFGLNGMGGGNRPNQGTPLSVDPADFTAFERNLSEIQYAYSREDLTALGRLTTPDMLRELGSQIEDNRRRDVRNDMADVRLLQGDLAEAWREGGADFATVAMRFAGRDVMLDRSTGRLVSGDPNRRVEATELWTFRRDGGAPWRLSAIQQTR